MCSFFFFAHIFITKYAIFFDRGKVLGLNRFFQRSCHSFNNHPLLQSGTRQRTERENSPKRGLLASHLVRKGSRCCPAFRSEVRQESRLHLFNAVLLFIFTDTDQKKSLLAAFRSVFSTR